MSYRDLERPERMGRAGVAALALAAALAVALCLFCTWDAGRAPQGCACGCACQENNQSAD